jgi:ribosomal protein S18 acetylase RimI-like enzyme
MPQQPTIEIRQATDADIPAIAHIINEAWKTAYVGIVPQHYLDSILEEDKEKHLREGLERVTHMRYFVLCENGFPVGAASLHRTRSDDMPDAAEFSFFYFLPKVWRRGYGTMLLDFLKRESANAGFLRICCWVLEKNQRAISFYESHGLLRDGMRQTETIGIPLEEVRCVARLMKDEDASRTKPA